MDDKYVKFFLDSKKSVIEFETIEISHVAFSRSFFLVCNATNGLTANIEPQQPIAGQEQTTERTFDYMPMQITQNSTRGDLDFGIEIVFGDLGELLTGEIKRVRNHAQRLVKPILIYRSFRSDDLSSPMDGPFKLQISSISFNQEGSTFVAAPPTINSSRTGEVYTTSRFKGLRGL